MKVEDLREYGIVLLMGTADYKTNSSRFSSDTALQFSSMDLSEDSLTEISETDNGGEEFVVVTAWNNARWFVPNKKRIISNVGNIIKPSSLKSRLVWKAALALNKFGMFDQLFRTKVYVKTPCLGGYFLDNRDSSKDYVIYTGSRGLHQKFTIQEMKDGKVLSFTKVGKHELAKQRIKAEANALQELNKQTELDLRIPQCLDAYERNGIQFMRQTPCGTEYSKIIPQFSKQHQHFLEKTHAITKQVTGAVLLHNIEAGIAEVESSKCGFDSAVAILKKSYDVIKGQIDSSVDYTLAFSHGDFTSWNCFSNGSEIFVFDWEEGEYRTQLWDYFNFLYHKNTLSAGADDSKLKNDLAQNKDWAEKMVGGNCLLLQRYYLINILIHYCKQEIELKEYGLASNIPELIAYFESKLREDKAI